MASEGDLNKCMTKQTQGLAIHSQKKELAVATIIFLPKASGLIGCSRVGEVPFPSPLQIFSN